MALARKEHESTQRDAEIQQLQAKLEAAQKELLDAQARFEKAMEDSSKALDEQSAASIALLESKTGEVQEASTAKLQAANTELARLRMRAAAAQTSAAKDRNDFETRLAAKDAEHTAQLTAQVNKDANPWRSLGAAQPQTALSRGDSECWARLGQGCAAGREGC